MFKKETLLFIILGGFFIANALIAEFIGVKIFSLESTLGIEPLNMTIWGVKDLSFNLTAGVLLWPVVFILTDIINEYYGLKGVKILSWLTAGLIAYAFLMIAGSLLLDPAGFWVERQLENGEVINMERSYDAILGQGNWIIIGSLVAFLIGQWADVRSFHIVRKLTGEKLIWARATGSTLISQLIDSFVVLFIAFYLGPPQWSFKTVIVIGIVNYLYKFTVAILLTPLLYLAHGLIDTYLGKERALALSEASHRASV